MNRILKIIIFGIIISGIIFLFFSLKYIKKGNLNFIKKDGKFLKIKEGIQFLPFKKIYSFKDKVFLLNFKGKLYTNGYDEVNSSLIIRYSLSEKNLTEMIDIKEVENNLENQLLNFSICLFPEEFKEEIFKEKFILYLQDSPYKIVNFQGRFNEADLEKAKKRYKEIEEKKRQEIFTFFIGLDALDLKILEPLIKENKCPNFKKIMENGTYGEILSEEPMLSPILWTTISTGKSPQYHKILEFTQRNENGEEYPITSTSRRCKALWNILSEAKKNVAFICWWVTDPPEWTNGILISDRLSYQLFGISPQSFELKKYLSPFPLIKLNTKIKSAEDISYEELKNIINIDKDEYIKAWEDYKEKKDPHKNRINHLRAILASTLNIHNITLDILKDNKFSLVAPYFEGTDTAAHRFAQFLPPKLDWVSEEEYKKYKDGLPNFYIFIDGLLGEYLKILPEDSVIFISSDHGFQTGAGRPRSDPEDMVLGAPQWHRKTGTYILSGKNIRKGKGDLISIKDIAPTLLYLQGLPVPEDMEGSVLEKPLYEIIKKRKIEFIKTYETLKERPEIGFKISKEEIEERLKELKALGYIGGFEEKKEKEKGSFTYYYNLANSYKFQGKRELAKLNYQKAIEVNPSFGLGYFELASIYSGEQNHQAAFENLKKALEVGKSVPAEGCIYLIDEALKSGNLKEAVLTLGTLEEKYKKDAPYFTALGISFIFLREQEKAKNSFQEALRIDPFEVYAIEEMLKYPHLNLQAEAIQKIKEGLYRELNKEKNLKLGKLSFEIGLINEAKIYIERVIKENPEDPEGIYLLGSIKVMEKNYEEGFLLFEKALKIEPNNPVILFNYGASLINSGKIEKGFIILQKAKETGYANPLINIALGKTAFRLNKKELARVYLKEALNYNETKKEAEELLKILN